jgi:uncharacterized protein
MIRRHLEKSIVEKFWKRKALVVIGARQTGKTTLVRNILRKLEPDSIYLNCDEPRIREMLEDASTTSLRNHIGSNKYVCIDEAQRVPGIGVTLKLITDGIPKTQLIVTGSSSLELSGGINEPLTGRKFEYMLHPISAAELIEDRSELGFREDLERRIVYGMYPDVINHPGEEEEILRNLAGSYLYKDLLALRDIRKPVVLEKLLQALAFQIGSEVSYNELSNLIGVDRSTIETYIDLLEKAFILFRLNPLARNLRNEIATTRKIFFWDTGIRNSIISNFSPFSLRGDKGALWENFAIAERLKTVSYSARLMNRWFWRTYQQQEIDYIEEYNGRLHTWECRSSEKSKKRIPRTFIRAYPDSTTSFVTPESFIPFARMKDIEEERRA